MGRFTSGQPPQADSARQVRIIGGRWRSRKIGFPDIPGLRPTGDRIRETLFNWLTPVLSGAHCLDLFAGSGAMGFEALSRGAAICVFVEKHAQAVRCLRESVHMLQAGGAQVIQMDALAWLAMRDEAHFDIIFMDPPFQGMALKPEELIAALETSNRLAPDAWLYLEQPKEAALPLLARPWRLHREQVTGGVRVSLWSRLQT